jgi:hypothetical protein
MTLKKYGSQPGSTRTSPTLGMGNRNAMQGGGTPAVGNTTQDHEAAAGKKVRARDIDAAMERRGRQREKYFHYSYSAKNGRCGTKTTRKAITGSCWR